MLFPDGLLYAGGSDSSISDRIGQRLCEQMFHMFQGFAPCTEAPRRRHRRPE